MTAGHRLARLSLYGLLYLALACAVTWPMPADLSGQIIGFAYGDGYETVHHVWWITEALRTGQNPFFAAHLGYPDGIDGVTLWAHPLQTFPAWPLAFLVGAPAAVNVAALLTLAANGLAGFALARTIAGGRGGQAAAFVAGAAYLLFPTIQGHLGAGHSGMIVQWPLALYATAAWRLRTDARPRAVAIAAGLCVTSAWGHALQAAYATAPVTLALLASWALARNWPAVRRLAMAAFAGAALLALFLLPSAGAALNETAYAEAGGVVRYSADLLAPVTPSFLHPLYSGLSWPARVLGVNLDEGAAYVGLIGGALAVFALLRSRAAWVWLALAVAAFVLSLGPLLKGFDAPLIVTPGGVATAITLPFAAIADLPVISLLRTPARFNLALALALCALIGVGAGALLRGRRRAPLYAAMLTALLAFDYWTFAPFPTTPAIAPVGVAALSDRADVRAVFDVPFASLTAAKRGLYLATLHGHPLIAGQVTRTTPVEPAKLAILEMALSPAHLYAAGADVVIVHRAEDADGALMARAEASLGPPTSADADVALFRVPPADAPGFTALPALGGLETRLSAYVYAPAATGALVTIAAAAPDGPRTLILRTGDGAEAGRYVIDGSAALAVFVTVPAGYSTVMLEADPPCLMPPSSLQTCRRLLIEAMTIAP